MPNCINSNRWFLYMDTQNNFSALRSLSESFSRHQIDETEYRAQRLDLLDQIERDINGSKSIAEDADTFMDQPEAQTGYDTQIFESSELRAHVEKLVELQKKQ